MGMPANRADRVFFENLIAQVFEPGDPFLAATANDDIKITVIVQIYWLRILRYAVLTENCLMPIGSIEWVTGYRVDRHGIRAHQVSQARALCTLVRSDGLRSVVTIQIC